MKDVLDSFNYKAIQIIQKAIKKLLLLSQHVLFDVNIYEAIFYENHIISSFYHVWFQR